MFAFRLDQAKKMFFDRQAIITRLNRAQHRVWNRVGALTRKIAKGSIRQIGKKGKPSVSPNPPKSVTGILKKFLFYGYDAFSQTVVIGPVKLNQLSFDGYGKPSAGTIPQVLEEGGRITIIEVQNPRTMKWQRKDHRYRRTMHGGQAAWLTRKRVVGIAERPYMGPAKAKVEPQIAAMFRDCLSVA